MTYIRSNMFDAEYEIYLGYPQCKLESEDQRNIGTLHLLYMFQSKSLEQYRAVTQKTTKQNKKKTFSGNSCLQQDFVPKTHKLSKTHTHMPYIYLYNPLQFHYIGIYFMISCINFRYICIYYTCNTNTSLICIGFFFVLFVLSLKGESDLLLWVNWDQTHSAY